MCVRLRPLPLPSLWLPRCLSKSLVHAMPPDHETHRLSPRTFPTDLTYAWRLVVALVGVMPDAMIERLITGRLSPYANSSVRGALWGQEQAMASAQYPPLGHYQALPIAAGLTQKPCRALGECACHWRYGQGCAALPIRTISRRPRRSTFQWTARSIEAASHRRSAPRVRAFWRSSESRHCPRPRPAHWRLSGAPHQRGSAGGT